LCEGLTISLRVARQVTDSTDSGRLCVTDSKLTDQAKRNAVYTFQYGFDDVYMNKWIERMDQNQELFLKVIQNADFSAF